MSDPGQVWSLFTLDPRQPEYAHLRASDTDRNVVHQVLADAFADGRLDRDEFESRSADASAAKTLGELVGPVDGLVPTSSVPARRTSGSVMSDAELEQRALEAWQRSRREAVWGLISISAVTWVIWAVFTRDAIPWPLFVMVATFLNLLKTLVRRNDMIADERRRLEKKRQREIDKRRRKGDRP
jgi:hypothetical protein